MSMIFIQPYTPNKTHFRWNRLKQFIFPRQVFMVFGRLVTPSGFVVQEIKIWEIPKLDSFRKDGRRNMMKIRLIKS